MTTTVYVRDVVNKRVHKRYREDGERALYSMEVEGDTSGTYEVMTDEEFERVEASNLCRKPSCFPLESDS